MNNLRKSLMVVLVLFVFNVVIFSQTWPAINKNTYTDYIVSDWGQDYEVRGEVARILYTNDVNNFLIGETYYYTYEEDYDGHAAPETFIRDHQFWLEGYASAIYVTHRSDNLDESATPFFKLWYKDTLTLRYGAYMKKLDDMVSFRSAYNIYNYYSDANKKYRMINDGQNDMSEGDYFTAGLVTTNIPTYTDESTVLLFRWEYDGSNDQKMARFLVDVRRDNISPYSASISSIYISEVSDYLYQETQNGRIYYNGKTSISSSGGIIYVINDEYSKNNENINGVGYDKLYIDGQPLSSFTNSLSLNNGDLFLPRITAKDLLGNESSDVDFNIVSDSKNPTVYHSETYELISNPNQDPEPFKSVITLSTDDNNGSGDDTSSAGYRATVVIKDENGQLRDMKDENDPEVSDDDKEGNLSQVENQHNKYQLIMYVRDVEYFITGYSKDNVSNEGNTGQFTIGLTRPADLNILEVLGTEYIDTYEYLDDKLYYKGALSLGSMYDNSNFGIESIKMTVGPDTQQTEFDIITLNPMIETDGDGNTLYLQPYSFAVTGLDPHKSYPLNITTTYKAKDSNGQYLTEPVEPKETVPVPNRPISELRESSEITIPLTDINFIEYSDQEGADLPTKDDILDSISIPDPTYIQDIEVLPLTALNFYDPDGDYITVYDFKYPEESGQYFILVEESYDEYNVKGEATPRNHYYVLTDRCYVEDNEINTYEKEIKFYSDDDPASSSILKTNSADLYISLNEEIEDESDIVKLEFFNIAENSSDKAYLDAQYESATSIVSVNPNSMTDRYIYNVSPDHGYNTEKTYCIAARIEDGAGNHVYLTSEITVDTKAPDLLVEGTVDNRGIVKVDSGNITYNYSYISDHVISLELKDTYIAENTDLSSVVASFYTIPDPLPVIDTESEDNCIKLILDPEYITNECIDLDVTLTDAVGNTSTSYLSLYTPGKLPKDAGDNLTSIVIDNHHNRPYSDYDSRGNYLSFIADDMDDYESVHIYPVENGVQITEYISGTYPEYEINNLDSHTEYTFNCYSVNGSGYENREDKSWGSITAITGNNSPAFEPIDTSGFVITDNVLYLNASSLINLDEVFDNDPDSQTVYMHINNMVPFAYDYEAAMSVCTGDIENEDNSGFSYTDGETYDLKLGVIDSWGSGDDIKVGIEVFYSWDGSDTLQFTYDGSGPNEADYAFEQQEEFSHINGDVYLFIDDTLCGLDTESIILKKDGTEVSMPVTQVTVTQNNPYNFLITLDEGHYVFDVLAEDRLGNESLVLQKSIAVDKQAPTVESLTLTEDENPQLVPGTKLLSNNHAVYTVIWKDANKPAYISYRYSNGNVIVFENILRVEGLSEETGEGQLTIDLPNGASEIYENTIYVLEAALCDQAGNWSDIATSPKELVQYDLNKPVLSLLQPWSSASDVVDAGGVNYVTSESIPEPLVSASDTVDSSVDIYYSVFDAATGIRGNEFTDISSINIPADREYILYVTAIDDALHQNSLQFPFVRDTQAPSNIAISFTDEKKETYFPGEAVAASFSGDGVETFLYRFESMLNSDVLTAGLPKADEDGWIPVSAGESSDYPLELPSSNAIGTNTGTDTVILRIKAIDVAGNECASLIPEAGNFPIDMNNESIAVGITPWIGERSDSIAVSYCRIMGSWKYSKGNDTEDTVTGYHYDLYKNGLVVAAGFTEDLSVAIRQDDPADGDEYSFKVYGIMDSGRETAVFKSVIGKVDTVAPEINSVYANDYATSETLRVSWDIDDSGDIASITPVVRWFRTGTNNGEEEIIEYEGVASDIPFAQTGTALLPVAYNTGTIQDGDKVVVQLNVTDHADNVSTKTSNVIRIDNTPPAAFGVIDQGDYVNPGKNNLYFDWLWSDDDEQSPIETTYYQLTRNGVVDQTAWVQLGSPAKELELSGTPEFENGSLVVLAVKKTNAAGLSTVGFTNGIVLDDTAGVILDTYFTLSGETTPLVHYTSTKDVTLWVDGNDPQSGISRITGELGFFSGCTWVPYGLDGIDKETENSTLDIQIPEGLSSASLFRYKVVLYNGAGDPSLPSYSKALWYDPAQPEISGVTGSFHDEILSLTWDSTFTIPFESGTINVQNSDGESVYTAVIEDNTGSYSIDISIPGQEVSDGTYRFVVQLKDMAQNIISEKSNQITIDTAAPVLGDPIVDMYVAETLDFEAEVTEPVSVFAYKLGTVVDDDALTGTWVNINNAGSFICMDDIDLNMLSGLETIDQSQMLLTLRCWDKCGNKSSNVTKFITVDLSPATVPLVSKDLTVSFFNTEIELSQPINFYSTKLNDIEWITEDELSGVVAYEWTMLDSSEVSGGWIPSIDESAWHGPYPLNTAESYKADLDGLALSDGQQVYAVIRVLNGSGLYSDAGMCSDLITIDLSGPGGSIKTDEYHDGLTEKESGDLLPTYNEDGSFELAIDSELSNIIHYTLEITDPSNILHQKNEGMMLNDGSTDQILDFTFLPESYGEYHVKLTLHDPGMNRNIIEKVFRYNAPPFGVLPDIVETNPARPFVLKGRDWYSDADGMTRLLYDISGDGGVLWSGEETTDNGEFPNSELTTALEHTDFHNQLTEYTMIITAEDSFGATVTAEIPVNVVNTQKGDLYTDEYWSGEHKLTGTVTVGNNLSLTLAPSTRVEILTGAVNGYGQELVIRPDALLEHEGTAEYFTNDIYGYWGGIVAEGDADLSYITLKKALRGITCNGESFSYLIEGTEFIDNLIGLHLVNGTSVSVQNSNFINNKHYGIKEEQSVNAPVIAGCWFDDNGFDYYDTQLTVLDYEGVNDLSNTNNANNGNGGE